MNTSRKSQKCTRIIGKYLLRRSFGFWFKFVELVLSINAVVLLYLIFENCKEDHSFSVHFLLLGGPGVMVLVTGLFFTHLYATPDSLLDAIFTLLSCVFSAGSLVLLALSIPANVSLYHKLLLSVFSANAVLTLLEITIKLCFRL